MSQRTPTNRDFLQSTKFQVNFSRLPGLSYFAQTALVPGLSLTEVVQPTPFIDLFRPGEKLIYDPLTLTFLVDEDLRNWQQLHDWLRGMTFPKDFKEYADLKRLSSTAIFRSQAQVPVQYTDMSLTIFTNKNNPNIRINFKDVFPTTVGSVQFSSMDSAENIITSDCSFRFSYYDIERI